MIRDAQGQPVEVEPMPDTADDRWDYFAAYIMQLRMASGGVWDEDEGEQ